MGGLVLVLSAIGLWLTWNVYRPSDRHPTAAVLSWIAGWVTGELALHWIAVQAAAMLLLAALGGLSTAPGQLGLGLSLLSWIGLGVSYARSARAAGAAERALQEGLGEDYAKRVAPALDEGRSLSIDVRRIANPIPTLPEGVERISSIPYGRERGVNLRLDIIRPRGREEPRPTLLQIHGGAWIYGSRRGQGLPLMHHMAQRGWLCASIDYRLSPHATLPEHLIDAKRALAWLRGRGMEYGVDPDLVVVTGGSAGGHLAALMALTANEPEYQPGFEGADTEVQGCVPFYGVYDLADRHADWPNDGLRRTLEASVMKASREEAPEAYEKVSPIARVHPQAPPFFVIHGDADSLVPVSMTRRFIAALREKSRASVSYAEIPGAQHAFDIFGSLRCQQVVRAVDGFLTHLRSERVATASAAGDPAVSGAGPSGVAAPGPGAASPGTPGA